MAPSGMRDQAGLGYALDMDRIDALTERCEDLT